MRDGVIDERSRQSRRQMRDGVNDGTLRHPGTEIKTRMRRARIEATHYMQEAIMGILYRTLKLSIQDA